MAEGLPKLPRGTRVLGAAAVMFLTTACLPVDDGRSVPGVQVTPPRETERYWKNEKFPLQKQGEFATERGKTRWFNFSSTWFDGEAARKLLMLFEELPLRRPEFRMSIFNPRQPQLTQEIIGEVLPKLPNNPTNMKLILIPDHAPLPNWAPPGTAYGSAVDTLNPDQVQVFVVVARVPVPPIRTVDELANLALGSAFCQASLQVSIRNFGLKTPLPIEQIERIERTATATFCDTLNFALKERMSGTTYQEYRKRNSLRLSPPSKSLRYLTGLMTKEMYEQLPSNRPFGSRRLQLDLIF